MVRAEFYFYYIKNFIRWRDIARIDSYLLKFQGIAMRIFLLRKNPVLLLGILGSADENDRLRVDVKARGHRRSMARKVFDLLNQEPNSEGILYKDAWDC